MAGWIAFALYLGTNMWRLFKGKDRYHWTTIAAILVVFGLYSVLGLGLQEIIRYIHANI